MISAHGFSLFYPYSMFVCFICFFPLTIRQRIKKKTMPTPIGRSVNLFVRIFSPFELILFLCLSGCLENKKGNKDDADPYWPVSESFCAHLFDSFCMFVCFLFFFRDNHTKKVSFSFFSDKDDSDPYWPVSESLNVRMSSSSLSFPHPPPCRREVGIFLSVKI